MGQKTTVDKQGEHWEFTKVRLLGRNRMVSGRVMWNPGQSTRKSGIMIGTWQTGQNTVLLVERRNLLIPAKWREIFIQVQHKILSRTENIATTKLIYLHKKYDNWWNATEWKISNCNAKCSSSNERKIIYRLSGALSWICANTTIWMCWFPLKPEYIMKVHIH